MNSNIQELLDTKQKFDQFSQSSNYSGFNQMIKRQIINQNKKNKQAFYPVDHNIFGEVDNVKSILTTTYRHNYKQQDKKSLSEVKSQVSSQRQIKDDISKKECEISAEKLLQIQQFFEQKVKQIQQKFDDKDKNKILQFFIDNLDYFQHSFAQCLCFKCECGLCKCQYELKQNHKIRIKGQFISSYVTDYQQNNENQLKKYIVEQFNDQKQIMGYNTRDIQGFNTNNQQLDRDYITQNKVNNFGQKSIIKHLDFLTMVYQQLGLFQINKQ